MLMMNKLNIFLVLPILLFLTACGNQVLDQKEVTMTEYCYDGVVYIERSGYSLSVKFNPDSTVATTLRNGVKCEDLK